MIGSIAVVAGVLGLAFAGISQTVADTPMIAMDTMPTVESSHARFEADRPLRVKITVDGTVFYADITDKAMAKTIAACLPLVGTMTNEDGHVMRYYADSSLLGDSLTTNVVPIETPTSAETNIATTAESQSKAMAQVGDIVYRLADNSLAIVYKHDTPMESNRVIGHIEDDGVLLLMDMTGETMTIEAAQ